MPEWIDFAVKTPDDLAAVLKDHFDVACLDNRYDAAWEKRLQRAESSPDALVLIDGGGYYWTLRSLAGVEHASYLLYDAPELVDELCERLHVTRRTLPNHFNSVLGMAPKDYLKRVRLNAVRRALQHGSDPARSVHDIAMQWGFWHLGHFSHDYRELFGELPSSTLRRALNGTF